MKRAAIALCSLCLGVAGAALAAGSEPPAASRTPDAPFRATRPAASVAVQFTPPIPTAFKLADGATLLVVEDPAAPKVTVDLRIALGPLRGRRDPPGIELLAGYALFTATRTRPEQELTEALLSHSVLHGIQIAHDSIDVVFECPAAELPAALELIVDGFHNPSVSEEVVAQRRELLLADRFSPQPKTSDLGIAALQRELHGDGDPRGASPAAIDRSVRSLRRADLLAFHRQYFHPENVAIAVIGNVRIQQVKALVEAKLAGWPRGPKMPARALASPPVAKDAGRRVVLVDLPKQLRALVSTAGAGPLEQTKAYDALQIVAQVLSGPGGRLERHKGGFVYSLKLFEYTEGLQTTLRADAWSWSAECGRGLFQLQLELQNGALTPPAPAEVELARAELAAADLSTWEVDASAARVFTRNSLHGLPTDYAASARSRYAAVEEKDLREALAKYLTPETWPVAIAGQATECEAKIKNFEEDGMLPPHKFIMVDSGEKPGDAAR